MQFPPKKLGEWINLSDREKSEWLSAARDRAFADDSGSYEKRKNQTVEINGLNVEDELSFYCEIGEAVNGPGGYFGLCFHSFDDCLFGGFGLDFPYKIVWSNYKYSKKHLNKYVLLNWLSDSENMESDWRSEVKQSWGNGVEDFFTVIVNAITSVPRRNGGSVQLELKNE